MLLAMTVCNVLTVMHILYTQNPSCALIFQGYGLIVFNNLTGGSEWIRPWPVTTEFLERMLLDGDFENCTASRGGFTASVPEWCCWDGVTCCLTSDTCPADLIDTSMCGGCDVGQVTTMSLDYNNVCDETSQWMCIAWIMMNPSIRSC